MIIDENRKIIFSRHQKTGSTSIVKALGLRIYERFPNQKELNKFIQSKTGLRYDGHHVPLYELKKTYPDIYRKRNDYFKFSFTRNPWDKLVSAWKFLQRRKYKPSKCNFKEFVKKNTVWIGVEMNTIDFSNGCDFIGKFENLQEDFDFICEKIGEPKKKLGHFNKTKHDHYTSYYDDETREIVQKKYAKDIEYFGYKF